MSTDSSSWTFDLYNSSFTEETYPNHALISPHHRLPLLVAYPGLAISDNDRPMLSDGREIAAIYKVNGTVRGRVNGTSEYEDLAMDAGYKGSIGFDGEEEAYNGWHYIPDDATTLTVTTIIIGTGEIIREDAFNLDLILDES